MRRLTWRIILSTGNLLVAIGLSLLGQREYDAFRLAHTHSDAVVPYLSRAQLVSYCLNAPAYVFTNIIGNFSMWRTFWGGKWPGNAMFHYERASFFVALSLFWWCIGWSIDVHQRHSRSFAVLGWVVGGLLSLVLAFEGIDILRTAEFPGGTVPGGRAIPIAMVVWGLVLLAYCGVMVVGIRTKGVEAD